jgi:DNA-binding beta-propeller fold protein YncE
MLSKFLSVASLLLASQIYGNAANFGTVVPVRGHLSDIAIDTQRNVVYGANFTANRVEVLSMASQSLLSPINVGLQPSALALSPDNRYLVVGHYGGGNPSPTSALTIIDLTTNSQLSLSLGTDSVLAIAFGNGSSALVITETGVSLLDPAGGKFTPLVLTDFSSTPLQVPWATYPAGIISGTIGVSADGNVIYALVDQGSSWQLVRYVTGSNAPVIVNGTSAPFLGPRSVSVNKDGSSVLVGWLLFSLHNSNLVNIAQFPYPPGIINQGGHAFDSSRNFIYAQVVPGAIQTPSPYPNGTVGLLQTFDTDNLTVRETFQLAENLAGRALVSGTNMYAISDSGIAIFPVGALNTVHRIALSKEDILFQSNGCNQGAITQTFDIVDPGGGATDFSLSSSAPGVTFLMNAGTTPASVKVIVDPAAFQDQKGTAAVTVTIASKLSVDAPATVRLLINTRNPDQQGAIYNVPGTVVDVLADPYRDRFYVLRQDRNQVLVFDGTSMNPIATLRTGNTPMQMAIYQDQLVVTNDNSQLLNVFDLMNLVPLDPVYLPSGLYARRAIDCNGQRRQHSRHRALHVRGMPQESNVVPDYHRHAQSHCDSGGDPDLPELGGREFRSYRIAFRPDDIDGNAHRHGGDLRHRCAHLRRIPQRCGDDFGSIRGAFRRSIPGGQHCSQHGIGPHRPCRPAGWPCGRRYRCEQQRTNHILAAGSPKRDNSTSHPRQFQRRQSDPNRRSAGPDVQPPAHACRPGWPDDPAV